MKQNELLGILAKDAPAVILGVVMGTDMTNPACKVKFANGSDLNACAAWLKPKFIAWSGRKEQILTVTIDAANFTVELKG